LELLYTIYNICAPRGLLKGALLQSTCDNVAEIRSSGKPPELIVKNSNDWKMQYTAIYSMQKSDCSGRFKPSD